MNTLSIRSAGLPCLFRGAKTTLVASIQAVVIATNRSVKQRQVQHGKCTSKRHRVRRKHSRSKRLTDHHHYFDDDDSFDNETLYTEENTRYNFDSVQVSCIESEEKPAITSKAEVEEEDEASTDDETKATAPTVSSLLYAHGYNDRSLRKLNGKAIPDDIHDDFLGDAQPGEPLVFADYIKPKALENVEDTVRLLSKEDTFENGDDRYKAEGNSCSRSKHKNRESVEETVLSELIEWRSPDMMTTQTPIHRSDSPMDDERDENIPIELAALDVSSCNKTRPMMMLAKRKKQVKVGKAGRDPVRVFDAHETTNFVFAYNDQNRNHHNRPSSLRQQRQQQSHNTEAAAAAAFDHRLRARDPLHRFDDTISCKATGIRTETSYLMSPTELEKRFAEISHIDEASSTSKTNTAKSQTPTTIPPPPQGSTEKTSIKSGDAPSNSSSSQNLTMGPQAKTNQNGHNQQYQTNETRTPPLLPKPQRDIAFDTAQKALDNMAFFAESMGATTESMEEYVHFPSTAAEF